MLSDGPDKTLHFDNFTMITEDCVSLSEQRATCILHVHLVITFFERFSCTFLLYIHSQIIQSLLFSCAKIFCAQFDNVSKSVLRHYM